MLPSELETALRVDSMLLSWVLRVRTQVINLVMKALLPSVLSPWLIHLRF